MMSVACDQTAEARVMLRPKVLVVDDEARILRFVQTSLTLAGYDAVTTTSGEEALKLAQTKEPDLIVLDVVMTPLDGFTVLERLRRFCTAPVIIFTASKQAADVAISRGANDVLIKPFRPDELIEMIRSLIPQAETH